MKENIYTIPVIESFTDGGECAFCHMHERLTQNAVEFMLGEAYMDDLIRMETNKTGFCREHLYLLFNQKNRLGLSLMMQTHMHDVVYDVKKMLNDTLEQKPSSGLFKKAASARGAPLVQYIKKLEHTCYMCTRIEDMFERYVDTFFFLWKKDDDIKELVKKSRGFCLNHYALLLETGEKKLSAALFDEFLQISVPIVLKYFAELEADLDWFIKKYDYRFAKEPWKNSQFSLQRTLKKMQSVDVGES